MKKVCTLSMVLFLVISCKEAIKNEKKYVAQQRFEDIQFPKPEITNHAIVNYKEDLLGYWVGYFKPDFSEEEMDSIFESESELVNHLYKKITFSIDEIKADSVFGHTICAGNISPFKGLLKENNNNFEMEVTEFKKLKTDGDFLILIQKNDSILTGKWNAHHVEDVQVAQRKFYLKKKFFKYDPNHQLDITFFNVDKSKEMIYLTDTIDGKVEEYIDHEYFATTDKLFIANASKDELSSDFVSNLTKADIFILRNSIFARHGFAFRDKQLRIYFEHFDWYMPVFGDVKNELTDVEKRNIDLLIRFEENAEEYYDTFGR